MAKKQEDATVTSVQLDEVWRFPECLSAFFLISLTDLLFNYGQNCIKLLLIFLACHPVETSFFRMDVKPILGPKTEYYPQVSALTAALLTGARVGTVDKFQGQEALIVIY